MLRKKTWNTELARNENFVCKYREKRGFKSCPTQYKLCYLSTSMHIVLFSNNEDHIHEEDSDYDTRVNYHWTLAQIKVIEHGVLSRLPNRVILKNLKENGEASNGKYPSLAQLGRKKRLIIKTTKKI